MSLQDKYNELKKEYKSNYKFELLLYNLNPGELIELLEIILIGDNEVLFPLFGDGKNIDPDEIAFDELQNLPFYLVERISECLNAIYVRASHKQYGKNTNRIVKKIITLGYNNIGLTNSTIIAYVTNSKLKCDFKIDLLFLLKHRGRHNFIEEFLRKYNVFFDPLLLPFVLSMCTNDKEILSYITKFDTLNIEKPSRNICNWFESTISDVVESFSISKSFKELAILSKLKSNWLREIVNETMKKETLSEIAKQTSKDVVFDNVLREFKRKVASIKKRYASYDLDQQLINREDALFLSNLSKWFGRLIPEIPPKIRLQVSTNIFEAKGTDYQVFTEKINSISTESDLTNKIRETQNL